MSLPYPHSGHDYDSLLERWERLAREEGWRCETLGESGGFPVLMVAAGRQGAPEASDVYLSAGVHGDECAPPWALLEWAESRPSLLGSRQALVFPCLNPAGLVLNTRADADGIDLNRAFHDPAHPLVGLWQRALGDRRFDCALLLHEDYAATGIYLYELRHLDGDAPGGADGLDGALPALGPGRRAGESLLAACEPLIGRETSPEVDGNAFENGHFLRGREIAAAVEAHLEGGWPEAIWLFQRHADLCFTFETPSELALDRRVETHLRFLETALG